MKYHSAFLVIPLFLFSSSAMSAELSKITKTSVTPTFASAGTMFKFTAELNAPLTAGNKVKIDLGKGLASMTGTKTSYSLSRAIYTTGSQTYKVGIYNAKNVLQGTVSSGNYTVSSKINSPPTLTFIDGYDTVEQHQVYTLRINATDIDNNLRSITVDWKDGSKAETQIAEGGYELYFEHVFNQAGRFTVTATLKDRGTPALTSEFPLKTILVTPDAGYTKVCNSGALEGEADCPLNPKLGTKSSDWACTKDNQTGLIWEVKTANGGLGLRDMTHTYTNYTADYPKPYDGYEEQFGSSTNTDGFVVDVNSQGLCGASDWRIPTAGELVSIMKLRAVRESNSYSAVDPIYFPNTRKNTWFWSSDAMAVFSAGYSDESGNYNDYGVRLVRGGQ